MIGLLTFYWADDYGAMLQSYALKKVLEKYGSKVEIIPYAPVKFTGRYYLFPIHVFRKNNRLKYRICLSLRNISILPNFLKRRKNMRAFRRQYLSKKKFIRNINQISLQRYSHVFIGSDQIWNPEITVGLDDAYIGNLNKADCRLIAYAASFGQSILPQNYHKKFTKAICNNFSAISLREKSAVPFVENLLGKQVINVLDPALLLPKKDWLKISIKPLEKDYILINLTEYNEKIIQYIHYLSNKEHKKVIQLSLPFNFKTFNWIEPRICAGPSEYIGYFENASYIITNSFHSTVFSILMEKQFLSFSHGTKNARLEDFLNILNLDSRLIRNNKISTNQNINNKIDWVSVKKLLLNERQKSIQYIYNCINTNI